MKNFIQDGEHITVTAAAEIASGDYVKVGEIGGVAQTTVASGEDVVLVRKGVFSLAKTSAQAWTVGAKVYWTGSEFSTTASGNTLVGVAVAEAANPSSTGFVLLDGAVR
ncbi:MAG: capsid cement protein [Pseudoruegeria sp.]